MGISSYVHVGSLLELDGVDDVVVARSVDQVDQGRRPLREIVGLNLKIYNIKFNLLYSNKLKINRLF